MGFPAALLVRLYKSYAHLKWALAAVASLALWIVFARVGYGDLASSLALAPSALVVVHVLFAVLVVYSGLSAQARAWASKRTPFATGTFLFPSGVIVARLAKLQIAPIEEITDVRVNGAHVEVVSAGKTFSFVADDPSALAAGRLESTK